jgi:FAD/FMN-containing dehydrogenase
LVERTIPHVPGGVLPSRSCGERALNVRVWQCCAMTWTVPRLVTRDGNDGAGCARLSRRAVLRLAAAGTAATLTGCTTSEQRGATAPPTPQSPKEAPPATSAGTPRGSQWDALAAKLEGRLVRRGEPGYRQARELFNPRFDTIRPQAVAYCATAEDVSVAVEFARNSDVALALRAGGHSYGGWSLGTGLVLDVSRLARVEVVDGTATVGAGARLMEVYDAAARRGRALGAGSCPTVGIAGLTLGGGVGVLTRAWGLTCDQLTGLDMVTADGRLVTVDATQDPDLFWACRGGGGGSFGVVTSLRFRLRPAPELTTWYYRWDWARAADVLLGWQAWAVESPNAMWSTCKLLTRPGESSPSAQVSGTWVGDPAGLDRHLGDIVASVGHPPVGRARATRGYLGTMLAEAGCSSVSAARCTTARSAFAATSHIIATAVPAAGVTIVVSQVTARQAGGHPRQAGVSFDVLGGAVADVASAETAFPHRDALAVAQYTVGWPQGQPDAQVRDDVAWLHGFRDAMTPHVGSGAFVNYADASLDGWQSAYYGRNYPRLQGVKRTYDPDNVFHFAQSVELPR